MVNIVLVRTNSIIYDPLVEKIVRSLHKRYSTLVLGWNREGIPRNKIDSYMTDLKLFNLRAPEGSPLIIALYPLFWMWVILNLFLYKPNVVHACDLDTVIPASIYKFVNRKKLVFHIFDRFAMGYISPKFYLLYSIVNFMEEYFSKHADVLATVSQKMLMTIRKKPKHSIVVMNCAEARCAEQISSNDDGILTLVYTGGIIRNRGLEKITAAVKGMNDVELIIAGKIIDKNLLLEILQSGNVEYKGLLDPRDAIALEAHSDVMIILYDPKNPNNGFAMPNKLFEAMMCGIPLITNVAPEIINDVGCGILVDYDDLNAIKNAVAMLKDDIQLRNRLGGNGRMAFLSKYNWALMERKFYEIYDYLLAKHS